MLTDYKTTMNWLFWKGTWKVNNHHRGLLAHILMNQDRCRDWRFSRRSQQRLWNHRIVCLCAGHRGRRYCFIQASIGSRRVGLMDWLSVFFQTTLHSQIFSLHVNGLCTIHYIRHICISLRLKQLMDLPLSNAAQHLCFKAVMCWGTRQQLVD